MPCTPHDPFWIDEDPVDNLSLSGFGDWPTNQSVEVSATFRVGGALPTHIKLDLFVGVDTVVTAYNADSEPIWSSEMLTSAGIHELEIEDEVNGGDPIAFIHISATDTEMWIRKVCLS